jgi:hypothetical protein
VSTQWRRISCVAVVIVGMTAIARGDHEANLLANPSFESDDDGNGLPDEWNIHQDARGKLVDKASDGKSNDVLRDSRAYPIRAVGSGMTGVGTWAYNVHNGSTWDDTDGTMVDYIFVYHGTEDHPLNKRLNPTGESVVPSIRWEALRAGIQDARVLLHLKSVAAADTCPQDLKADIERVVEIVEALGKDGADITWEKVAEVSRRARQLLRRY